MSIESSDVVFLLQCVATVTGHPETGDSVVKLVQAQIKSAIAGRPELQRNDILQTLDVTLKLSSAGQIPATYIPATFVLTDYVDPVDEPQQLPTIEPFIETKVEPVVETEERDIPF